MGKAYILNQKIDKEFNAAGKAMSDVFTVFTKNGVKVIPGIPKSAPKYLKALDIPVLFWYLCVVMKKGDYCIFSYPENNIKIKFIKKLAFVRKIRIVCFINDINSIREGNFDSPEVKNKIKYDMALIGTADIVLAPNNNSRNFLISQGIRSEIIPVGTWDYLMEEVCPDKRGGHHDFLDKWKIAFAGNLDKALFINDLSELDSDNIKFFLWGNSSYELKIGDNCNYMGSVSPKELPYSVKECDFGLVWDGTGVHSLSGGLGEYLRYNNSHKCGLYLAAGLPVFVWENAGLADFVRENGCGYVISSLDDLEGILSRIDEKEYMELLERVSVVSAKVRDGYYLLNALNKMYELRE